MPSAAERLAHAHAQIAALRDLNAFISLSSETPGGEGPIVAVKDLIDVRGLSTGGGAAGPPPPPARSDARVVSNLRAAGGMVVGKTNMYEWAFGVSGHNPHHGDVKNPHAPAHTSGGSSGGSAVAVATGMCDWAIGTDTGGSIRIPASLCGVVGFKPTRGLLSTRGVLPLSRTLDTVGSLARDVRNAARAVEILAGDLAGSEPGSLATIHLAVPRGWVSEGELDVTTRSVWTQVARSLPTVELPSLERAGRAARTVLEWEAAVLHGPSLRRSPERYGSEVRARLEEILSRNQNDLERDHAAALVEMLELREQVEHALLGCDALMLPVTSCVAPLLSDGASRRQLTRFTRPFNLTGHPVIALPGPSPGLPVGVQLVGRLGQEARLAEVASALERDWSPPRLVA